MIATHPRIGRQGAIVKKAEVPKRDQQFRLPAVDRAMSLLELLAISREGLTLSEVSRKLSIPKSTTHYLIHTLETRGYVQRGNNGRHSLGLRFADVASASTAELDLGALATPFLKQISARVNLTATLSVLRGAEAVIIGKATSFLDAGGGAWVGRHLDLHCTAQGKALIAQLPEADLNKLFGGRALAQFTPKTIVTLVGLKTHLAEVRSNGFAVNNEEQVYGVRAVAVPIVNVSGAVIAAISLRGSSKQISPFRLPELGQELIRVSRDLSLQMSGY
jgi:IclR family acetate operon transcriptional repressor